MAKKQEFSLGSIKQLNKSQLEVLKELLIWNYNTKKATINNLSLKTGYSFFSVNVALMTLKARGIVSRNNRIGYFIDEKIKKIILSEVKLSEIVDINKVELKIQEKENIEKKMINK